jgi:hypothetical protein
VYLWSFCLVFLFPLLIGSPGMRKERRLVVDSDDGKETVIPLTLSAQSDFALHVSSYIISDGVGRFGIQAAGN